MTTIGILGGMGPLATVDLQAKIIWNTPADRDQDHLRTIVWSDPTIPSRSQAILHRQPSPLPQLIHGANTLARAGADFYVIACHAAHHWQDQLQEAVPLPLLSMIDLTVQHLAGLRARSVGILATRPALAVQLYQRQLRNHQIEAVLPEPYEQEAIDQAVLDVKAGRLNIDVSRLNQIVQRMDVDHAIAACTELPLVLPGVLDPTLLLAKAVIQRALAPHEAASPAPTPP